MADQNPGILEEEKNMMLVKQRSEAQQSQFDKAQDKTQAKENDNDLLNDSGSGRSCISCVFIVNILFILSFIIELDISSANQQNFAMKAVIDDFPYNQESQRVFKDIASLSEASVWMKDVLFENIYNGSRTYSPNEYESTLNRPPPGQNQQGGGGQQGGQQGGQGGGGNRLLYENYEDNHSVLNHSRILADEHNDLMESLSSALDQFQRGLQQQPQQAKTNYYFISQFNMYKGMRIIPTYNPQLNIPQDLISEAVFFESTLSKDEAKNKNSKLDVLLNKGLLKRLEIQIFYFNLVNQVGTFYTYAFGLDENSKFSTERKVTSFFPKTFDTDSVYSRSGVIIAFRSLFCLQIFLQFFGVIIVDVCKRVKTMVQTHRLDCPSSTYFNVALLFIMLLTLIWGFELNLRMGNTVDPLTNIDEVTFETFLKYANDTVWLRRILSIAIFFLVVESLLLLNTKFPTFGVLFITLSHSKNEIIFFLILVFTLLTGFVVFLSVNFGLQDTDFSSFGNALIESFQFIVGGTELAKLINANKTWSGIYFFVFYVLFNLLLLLIFVVIIMSTYVSLRVKLQILTLAHAQLAAEKSKVMQKKYLRLLLCKDPEVEDMKEKREQRKNDEENQVDETTNDDKLESKVRQKNLHEIFFANLEEVDYFGLLNNKKQTRDEFERDIEEQKKKILKEKEEAKEKKKKSREEEVFNKLFNVFVHIIFLIIYFYTMDFELRKQEGFELNSAIQDEFLEKQYKSQSGLVQTFSDVSTIGDVINWLHLAYFPIIYTNWPTQVQNIMDFNENNLADDDTGINDLRLRNRLVGNFATRITFRNLKITKMPYNDTTGNNQTFYQRNVNDISYLDPTSNAETDVAIQIGDTQYQRLHQGSFATARSNGGYVVTFPRNLKYAISEFKVMQHPKILNINTGSICIQSIWANDNYQIMGLTEFVFDIKATGAIEKTYRTYPFQINFYSCEKCWMRLVLEIIYILFVLRQAFIIGRSWLKEWNLKEHKRLTPVQRHLKASKVGRLLNYDFSKCSATGCLYQLLIRLWQFFNRFITTTLSFARKSASNIVLTLSIIITFIGIIVLIQLMANKFRQEVDVLIASTNYDITNYETRLNLVAEMGQYESIAILQRTYSFLQSINAFFIGIRILFDYGFSKELSLVLELVGQAIIDILFFVLMFFLILFGFALNGYILFGLDTEQFKSVGRSLLQVLLIMTSESDSTYMTNVDAFFGIVYYLLIIIVCFLILLKMFIAILDGYFMDLTQDSKNTDSEGFLNLIVTIITNQYSKKSSHEIYEQIPSKASRRLRATIYCKNCFKKLKNKGVNFIKKCVLGGNSNQDNMENGAKKNEREANKVNVQINFQQNTQDNRASVIEDILFGNPGDRDKDIDHENGLPNDEQNSQHDDHIDNDDDESEKNKQDDQNDIRTIPHEWMKILEDNLYQTSGKKIQLSKFGTNSKDYAAIEGHLDQEVQKKIKDYDEQAGLQPENDYNDDADPNLKSKNQDRINELAEKWVKNYETKVKKKKKSEMKDFEELGHQLFYLYWKSLNFKKTDISQGRRNQNKLKSPIQDPFKTNADILSSKRTLANIQYDEAGNEIAVQEENDFQKTLQKRLQQKQGSLNPTLKELDYESTPLFRENIVDEKKVDYLLKLWNALTIEHKYMLWAGKYKDKMPVELRHHLWRYMQFDESLFTAQDSVKKKYSEVKQQQNSEPKFKQQGDLYLIKNLWIKLESGEEKEKRKANIDKLEIGHINLLNYLVKGQKQDVIISLRKMSDAKARIKYLQSRSSHAKSCQKLQLWLLADPWTKINLAMRESDDYYAFFTLGLLVEEVFDNTILLLKLERDLNADFKSRIYMHFFQYANLEALVYTQNKQKNDELDADDEYLFKYLKYLKDQFNSSNETKKKQLKELNDIIEEANLKEAGNEIMNKKKEDEFIAHTRSQSKTDNIDKSQEHQNLKLDHNTFKQNGGFNFNFANGNGHGKDQDIEFSKDKKYQSGALYPDSKQQVEFRDENSSLLNSQNMNNNDLLRNNSNNNNNNNNPDEPRGFDNPFGGNGFGNGLGGMNGSFNENVDEDASETKLNQIQGSEQKKN